MPVSYKIDPTLKTIHTKCIGNVTFNEVIDHFYHLQEDPGCPDTLDVLLDLTECTSVPGSDQLRTVGDTIGRIQGKVRFDACAIVASQDLMFGMARMFQVFAETRFRATQVFRKLDEAEKWLSSRSQG